MIEIGESVVFIEIGELHRNSKCLKEMYYGDTGFYILFAVQVANINGEIYFNGYTTEDDEPYFKSLFEGKKIVKAEIVSPGISLRLEVESGMVLLAYYHNRKTWWNITHNVEVEDMIVVTKSRFEQGRFN